MKLLILTQKVDINDDLLGFMHGWIAEFSKKCEKVTVIALGAGEYDLPENVKVLSLGKEKGRSKLKYLVNFYKYIWRERKNYDAVFVHMNKEYVILGGLIWKMLNKKIGLWYAHGYAPKSLKIAERLADYIFTSTRSGFRLESQKINIVGQGTDLDKFKKPETAPEISPVETGGLKTKNNHFKIISIGRIAPSKDYPTLIKAAEILNKNKIEFKIKIIGGASLTKHENYFKELKAKVKELGLSDRINFMGAMPYRNLLAYLNDSDLFVNMSQTGSLDKAILEAMACELPILTCNEALNEVLGKYREILMYGKSDYRELAEKIKFISGLPPEKRKKIGEALRRLVAANHSLSGLIDKILFIYEQKN